MTNSTARHAPLVLLAAVLLVVGTAGGAVAAKMITGKDVKNSSLTGKDIKNGSLGASELSGSAKASLKGNAGANGAPGISGYENVLAQSVLTSTGNVTASVLAFCPRGKKAVGGGAYWVGLNPLSTIAGSGPVKAVYAADGTPVDAVQATASDASGWIGTGRNNSGSNSTLYVFVTCANVS